MQKKLVIINGVMGVGKTTTCKLLYKELDNSFWLDGDNVWVMNPFKINIENKTMVLENISYILNNFIKNKSAEYILFNWVIETEGIMNELLSRVNTESVQVIKITLTCSRTELLTRIKNDIKEGLRSKENIEKSLKRYSLYEDMNTIKLNSTNKTVKQVVEQIKTIVL